MNYLSNPTFYYFWYKVVPREISFYFKIIRYKLLDHFSVPIILRTFFEPWKRDVVYVSGASLEKRLHIWFLNMVSRLIGATMRFFVLIGFLFSMLIWLFVFINVLIVWFFFPVVLIFLIVLGIYFLFQWRYYGGY